MKSKGTTLLGAILALSAIGALSAESINPPTMPQTAPMDKQAKKNLDMVLEWWRIVIQGGPPGSSTQIPSRGLYPAQSKRQHRARRVR